jgi:hypothetical protein
LTFESFEPLDDLRAGQRSLLGEPQRAGNTGVQGPEER